MVKHVALGMAVVLLQALITSPACATGTSGHEKSATSTITPPSVRKQFKQASNSFILPGAGNDTIEFNNRVRSDNKLYDPSGNERLVIKRNLLKDTKFRAIKDNQGRIDSLEMDFGTGTLLILHYFDGQSASLQSAEAGRGLIESIELGEGYHQKQILHFGDVKKRLRPSEILQDIDITQTTGNMENRATEAPTAHNNRPLSPVAALAFSSNSASRTTPNDDPRTEKLYAGIRQMQREEAWEADIQRRVQQSFADAPVEMRKAPIRIVVRGDGKVKFILLQHGEDYTANALRIRERVFAMGPFPRLPVQAIPGHQNYRMVTVDFAKKTDNKI